ncbi:MAG: hypothetical protein KGJ63_01780 [Pseudomonadota bacterium]|nr:hypothetical protein [Pseudomonadota bacterium]
MASMHPADRRWMLSRMPKTWRSSLAPLIHEAARFASIDADVLQAALDGQDEAPTIDVPTPAVLIAVLDTLSSHWAACALAAAAADHAEIYLAACDKPRGAAIRRATEQLPNPFPGALAAALARCLHDAGQVLRATEALR